MANKKRGILLVNLGSPDSTEVKDVRRYLGEFLMDERVIDAPYLIRKMIVSCFILPFRPKESAHAYKLIWWDEGSPLIVLSRRLQKLMQEKLDIPVELGMRYGNPSIENSIKSLMASPGGIDEIFLVPLYPHYAMATTETVIVEAKRVLAKLKLEVDLTIQPPFYDDPDYIRSLVDSARPWLAKNYDHLLMSYHGIPERHCRKSDPTGSHCLKVDDCCHVASAAHQVCYRHHVVRTTEEFIKASGIAEGKCSFAFQSKLGVDAWLQPPTDEALVKLAKSGVKKLLVMCPAFVSDCIETLEELGIRGKEAFLAAGGEEFELIPCINENALWLDALLKWAKSPEVETAWLEQVRV